MSLKKAIDSPRVHNQLYPDARLVEAEGKTRKMWVIPSFLPLLYYHFTIGTIGVTFECPLEPV